MEFYFGSRSLLHLQTCHWNLQCVAQEAIKTIDFSIICGHRGKRDQTIAFNCKASMLQWQKSFHNTTPACAFDFLPHPFTNWKDIESFLEVVEIIQNSAKRLNIEIIAGADNGWDFGHIQLKRRTK